MKVGIIGNGQLGQMLAQAGAQLNLDFAFYAKSLNKTTEGLGELVIGDFNNELAFKDFVQQVDVITYENENIPRQFIQAFQDHIYPNINVLGVMQDRLHEKKLFQSLAIPTNKIIQIDDKSMLQSAAKQLAYPFVVKRRREGYDGKGQIIIQNEKDLATIPHDFHQDCIAEEFIPFDREVSIIAVRDQQGHLQFYDLCENKHIHGILYHTQNRINDNAFSAASSYIKKILEKLNYVGVCALELFEANGQLYANELAPRVHNTGHWTIEGAKTSQFENHLRAITGMTLGSTDSVGEFSMFNLISEIPKNLESKVPHDVYFHDYLKTPRPKRKLAHITIKNQNLQHDDIGTLIATIHQRFMG